MTKARRKKPVRTKRSRSAKVSHAISVQSPPSIVLTDRELSVLRGIVAGQTNVAIGSALGISYETVKTYVNRLRTKTGARTKTEIAVLAIRLKLVAI